MSAPSSGSHSPLGGRLNPPPAVSQAIRQRIASDLTSARGPSLWTRWALGWAAMLAGIAASLWVREGGLDWERALLVSATGAGISTIVTLHVFVVANGARLSIAARRIAALLPVFAVAVVVLVSQRPASLESWPPSATALAGCVGTGVLFALLPFCVTVLAWRRTDPFTPTLLGAVIGGWTGLAGTIGLTISCASGDIAHVALGHGLIVAIGASAGAFAGRRWLPP